MSLAPLERTAPFSEPYDRREIEILELTFHYSAELTCEWDGNPARWIWYHGTGDWKVSHICCDVCKTVNDSVLSKCDQYDRYCRCLECEYEFDTETYYIRPI